MARQSIGLLLALFLSVGGCTSQSQDLSLYDRLGGAAGVDALVYQMLVNIAQDARIRERFNGVDIEQFRTGLARYICHVSDGGCDYKGDSMQQIHAGHGYTDAEFNALVSNLMRAMESQEIPTRAQNALLAQLAPSYKDIVYQ